MAHKSIVLHSFIVLVDFSANFLIYHVRRRSSVRHNTKAVKRRIMIKILLFSFALTSHAFGVTTFGSSRQAQARAAAYNRKNKFLARFVMFSRH